MSENVLFAFGLTAVAGLCTGIGSALAFFTKRTNKAFLSSALGFSAGVMIYVSLVEIIVKARDSLVEVHGADLCKGGMARRDVVVPDREAAHTFGRCERRDMKRITRAAALV